MPFKPLPYGDLADHFWDRHKRAWALRVKGLTYREVAKAMGLRDDSQARNLVRRLAIAMHVLMPYRKHGWGKR